jgi:endonuclease-3 related protein
MASHRLQEIFAALLARYGPRHWWPGETPFEVCVGAILTQNTNWGNVEKAISNLKQADQLSVTGIASIAAAELAIMIRPAGYFNIKAARLKEFVTFLHQNHQGSLDRLFSNPWQQTRLELLAVKGIGPETADSILLYAGHKPSFVVDTYTRRIFSRLALVPEQIRYDELRRCFMDQLFPDPILFNEYHALIVELGKSTCRPKPRCSDCCLTDFCYYRTTKSVA